MYYLGYLCYQCDNYGPPLNILETGSVLNIGHDTWSISSNNNEWLKSFIKLMWVYQDKRPEKKNYDYSTTTLCDYNLYQRNHLRVWFNTKNKTIFCEFLMDSAPNHDRHSNLINSIHALFPIYLNNTFQFGLPLHGALLDFHSKGVILAGKGGAGKSTCCRRLPDEWNASCDDEVLISKCNTGRLTAYPIPTWSDILKNDKSDTTKNNRNISINLVGLFFIEQSMTDYAAPIGKAKAAVRIYESAMQIFRKYLINCDLKQRKEIKEKLFKNSCELSNLYPSYRLSVSKTGKFWKEIQKCI